MCSILAYTEGRMRIGLGANVTPTPSMQMLAQLIQQEEGYAPGTTSYADNNPGNLVYAGQPGATQGPGGFAVFDSYQDGLQALYNQLNLYATGACQACNGQPQTIASMTAIYAPAGQGNNNPAAYASFLASGMGVDSDTSLSDIFDGSVDASTSPEPMGIDVTDPTTIIVAGLAAVALLVVVMNA